MSAMNRLWFIIKSKFAKAVDRAEDPRETLDYSYEQQVQLLQQVKRGTAEVVTAKKRVEMTADKRREQLVKLEKQARQAITAGREDLARLVLARKAEVQHELRALDAQVQELDGQQQTLVQRERDLRDRIERFRSEKEVLKAQYSTAEAMVQIGEATTGLGKGLSDAGRAIERAREKTEQMQARAAAIDELVASGTIVDQLAPGETAVDRELAALSRSAEVEAELDRLTRELGTGTAPRELTGESEP
jgi:phage shock protein A